jgi:hypothetical protein
VSDRGAVGPYLERLRAALGREPRAAEILAEVADHLAESRAALIAAGFPAAEAEAETLRRHGDVAEVAAAYAEAGRAIRRSRLLERAAALWWLSPALAVVGHPLGWWLRDAAAAGGVWRILEGLLSFGTPAVGLYVLLAVEERPGELAAGRYRRAVFWGKLALLSPVLLLALHLTMSTLSAPRGWLFPLWRVAASLLVVASPFLLPAPRPTRAESRAPRLMAHVRRAHVISAAVMVAFAALHLGSHLAAFWSIEVNRAVSAVVRPIYAHEASQALVSTAIAVQVATGLLVLRAGARSRRRAPEKLQALSGLYLGAFVVMHAVVVLVLLRGVRLDFLGSTGGARGLLGSYFLPCYALAPLAFFVHLAYGLRRLAPPRLGRVLARSTLVGGVAVSVAITLAMAGWHIRDDRAVAASPRPRMAAAR